MTGVGTFVRMFLRRDRWMILWFVIGTTALYYSQAVSVDGLYKTQSEFDKAAATMGHNAAFVAMAGPARALNTTGGQVTWQAAAFGAIVVGLLSMFLIGRHTRAEEESGRDELVRSGVVGRFAPMTAALVVATLAGALVGLGVALSLVAYGLPAAGAWSLGLGVWLCGAAFAGVALLAAQLTEGTRAMYGITGAVIGLAYGLRAIGDVSGGGLSWLSPIGWYQAMHAYSGERWWPALLLVALAALAAAAAYAVFDRRDVGAGVWASRPGPARGSMGGNLGLAWRLHRGSVIGWSAGMFLGGLGYGSIGNDVGSLMGDSSFSKDVFGVSGADLIDGFYAAAALMLVLIASGYTIASALRSRGEEDAGRVESLLATALPRRDWMLGHVLMTVLGTVLVVGLAGLGLGMGYAMVTGDGAAIGRLTLAALSLTPGALLLGALARLLGGLVPRWASLAWLALAFCVVVMFFGAVLRFPGWVRSVSPFDHLAQYPAEPIGVAALLGVIVVAVLVSVGGVTAFLRRDVR